MKQKTNTQPQFDPRVPALAHHLNSAAGHPFGLSAGMSLEEIQEIVEELGLDEQVQAYMAAQAAQVPAAVAFATETAEKFVV